MSNDREISNTNNNGTCVVCYKNVEIYSIGMCEHPVCYECSTRMRVLCRQNECPICRQDLPKVVFTRNVKPFRLIKKGNLLDTRYNIYFDSLEIQEKFIKLLAHVCPICDEKQVFGAFNGLSDHMRRRHELHYCDLCVENLKIFSFERRCYSRADLAHHRRKGDIDDKSHKGHPLCEFCDCRYMDNDELFRHLRRDHLFCHFCDADGLHQYYSSYDYLRDHFRQEHYLCEEGPCADEKFTSVFRSDIDVKAHKASVHGKFLGKAAAKQARTLELEFTLAPRGDNRNNRRGGQTSGNNPSNMRNRDYVDTRESSEAESTHFSESEVAMMRQPDVQSTQEFPSLGNATPPMTLGQTKSKGRGNLTIRGSLKPQTLAITDENFPALGPESMNNSGISKTVNLSVYSKKSGQNSISQHTSSAPSQNVSIHVNHRTDGSITTRVSGPNLRVKPTAQLSKKSDFPALGRSEISSSSASSSNSAQWTKVTCVKPEVIAKAKKVAPTPRFDSPPPASFTEAFPSLPKSTKAKKQSSISVTSSTTSSNDWNRLGSTTNETSIDRHTPSNVEKANPKKKKKKKVKGNSSNNSSGNESSSIIQCNNGDFDDAIEAQTSRVEVALKNMKTSLDSPEKGSEKTKKEKKKGQNSSNNQTMSPISVTKGNSSSNVIRKRSELKIDNLNNTNNVGKKEEDFPMLGKSVETLKTSNPPPGFGAATPPPPGFAVKLNSVERSRSDNSLTFTNSSGESFSILPTNQTSNTSIYVPPPDFQKRNKKLVDKITEVLGLQESIEEFRYLSGLFRQDACSTEDYYKRCRSAMGLSAFATVFPEMIVLLPDIRKQRELFELHRKEVDRLEELELCPNCGQVVKTGGDLKSHMSTHTLESHFPALGRATAINSSNNWPRRNA